MKFLFIFVIVFFKAFFLNAQSIEIISTDIEEFPLIKSDIFIFDEGIYPVNNINGNQILINDKGLIVSAEDFQCVNDEIFDTLKIVIAFDNGINRDSINGISNYDIAFSTLNTLIKAIDTTHTKVILTTFDYQNYLISDFTNSRDSLNTSIINEFGKSSSYLYPSMDFEPVGANNLLDYYDLNTAIIITDGNQKAGLDSISVKFQEKGLKVFAVQINSPASSKLSKICNETTGFSFPQITAKSSKISLAKKILSMAKGYKPCKLSWFSEISCNDTSGINLTIPSLEISKDFSYIFESEAKPALISTPLDLGFTLIQKVDYINRDIAISAKNTDIFISDMFIEDERFEIVNGYETNFILNNGQSKVLRIRFTPTDTGTRLDSAIVFTRLVIESDACSGNEIYMTAGYPNKPPVTKTIKVTNPKCGETLLVGDTIRVEWIGILRKDVVQIEYSTNNGVVWDSLSYNTDSLFHEWIVPDEVSDSCLIRVLQKWPNNVSETIDLKHNGPVHSGFFNKEGNKAVTASSDGTVVIWNANTGSREKTFYGHNGIVTFAVFSPSEEYVASSSRDSTIILWNIATGEIIRTFEGHTGFVNSVNFSFDGKYLVSAGSDGNVIVWETETGDLVNTFDAYPGNTGRAWYASFCPQDEFILTSGNSGIAKMIDWNTGETIQTFDSRNSAGKGDAKQAIFNYNASKVALVSAFDPKRVLVWEIDGKDAHTVEDTLFTITHNPDSTSNILINTCSFYFDGNREYILTAATDNTARKWDANSGLPTDPHVFDEHKGYVETAVFNFDARMVLTTSLDKTAKIWNLDRRDLQMDTTDCVFAIAYANAEAYDIAIGDVPFKESKDTLIFPLKNLSDFDYEVSSARIINDLTNSFMFVKDEKNSFILDSLDSTGFEIRYEAKELGSQTCSIEFQIPGKSITANISANTVLKDIKEYTNLIDFGKVEFGGLKDTTFSVILSNESEKPIMIDSIYFLGYSKGEFNFSDIGELPITLNSGDYLPAKIRFSPKFYGLKNAKLVFNHSGRFSPAEINLFGQSDLMIRDTVTLSIDDATGEPGEIIDIPVRISISDDRPLSPATDGFIVELCFNSTMLEPLGNFKNDYFINDYLRCIEFQMNKEDLNEDIIKTLQFKVGLGNDSLSKLDLRYSSPIGKEALYLIEEDGQFTLNGFCNSDDPRLFDPYGRILLEQNIPNPAINSTSISFQVIEPGNVTIEVRDILGNKSLEILNEFLMPGNYTRSIDVSNLASGTYIYTLTTKNHKFNRKMEIRK
jgi:WD40 repeat protein